MKKEELTALGLTEEQASKVAEASEKELEGYVPKHKYEEVDKENKTLKSDAAVNKKALEELKESAGNNEELSKQIRKLQDEAADSETRHKEELKELKLTNAIKLSLSGSTHDEELVAGLFDKSKLILGDDGKVTGLDEQLKGLKESKPYLFKTEETKPGFHKVGALQNTQTQNGTEGKQQLSMKDAISAAIQSQKE